MEPRVSVESRAATDDNGILSALLDIKQDPRRSLTTATLSSETASHAFSGTSLTLSSSSDVVFSTAFTSLSSWAFPPEPIVSGVSAPRIYMMLATLFSKNCIMSIFGASLEIPFFTIAHSIHVWYIHLNFP